MAHVTCIAITERLQAAEVYKLYGGGQLPGPKRARLVPKASKS